ncbi:hypothetical protein SUGI_0307260 [Cryptomeria japonica]|uniref:putative FBD-associated F-box protein At5g56410 n=1 Tax=Cryptomeria japonica TaxID=3369 RepID=UPI0024089889|nr:putative FBD-associated F-box protein At5g56410 [Cryptomeria japonica]GLJ17641.1 hypothetical protein SUGI_0307260 [Cryptomeria japonica]
MAITRLMARASTPDRLSALSDDVLLDHIFTKISYRDVVRSSILSQRWRFLWRKTPILKFCLEDFRKQKDDMRIQAIINKAFLHLDARLLYLNLRVALDDPKAADINNWIRLAAEKKVERMELYISYRDPNTRIDASTIVELGDSFLRCENLTALVLKSINLPMIPNNFGVFQFLETVYCVGILNLDDVMFEQFMAVCPHLRNLGIRACMGLRNLNIRSSNLMSLNLGALSPHLSLQMVCPRLIEISLTDCGPYPVLKLLQGISRAESRSESIKRITLLNYNTGNAINPGIPSIAVLNSFPGLEELIIHGQCFQEMISYEISVAELTLSNLKMVRAHIGLDKGEKAVTFLGFLLRHSPLTVTRVFLPERCPRIMRIQLQDLEMKFSKSRLSTATRRWSINSKEACQFCEKYVEY